MISQPSNYTAHNNPKSRISRLYWHVYLFYQWGFLRVRFEPATFQLQAINLTTKPSSPDQLWNYHGYIAPDVLILFRIILCRVHSTLVIDSPYQLHSYLYVYRYISFAMTGLCTFLTTREFS